MKYVTFDLHILSNMFWKEVSCIVMIKRKLLNQIHVFGSFCGKSTSMALWSDEGFRYVLCNLDTFVWRSRWYESTFVLGVHRHIGVYILLLPLSPLTSEISIHSFIVWGVSASVCYGTVCYLTLAYHTVEEPSHVLKVPMFIHVSKMDE